MGPWATPRASSWRTNAPSSARPGTAKAMGSKPKNELSRPASRARIPSSTLVPGPRSAAPRTTPSSTQRCTTVSPSTRLYQSALRGTSRTCSLTWWMPSSAGMEGVGSVPGDLENQLAGVLTGEQLEEGLGEGLQALDDVLQ